MKQTIGMEELQLLNDEVPSSKFYYSLDQVYRTMELNIGMIAFNLKLNRLDKINEYGGRTLKSLPPNERYCCWGIYPNEIKEILIDFDPSQRIGLLRLILENKEMFHSIYDVIDFLFFITTYKESSKE